LISRTKNAVKIMSIPNDKTMNSEQRQQTTHNQTKVCFYCGFAENPLDVSNCLQCDRSLEINRQTTRASSSMWSRLPLILLLLVSAVLGFFWRKNSASLQQATKSAFTPTTATQAQPKTNDSSSKLQLTSSLTEVQDVPQGIFFYSGAMASAGIRSQDMLAKITKAQPQFQITYEDPLIVPPDSGAGIQMTIDGTISFAESFRPLKQSEYDLARSRGFKLKQIPIATSAIAFYTNPNLNIPGLSLEQVEQIYSGQITNWKQVGGPDLPIVPISQDPDAKASNSFLLQGLSGSDKKFGSNVTIVRDTTNAVRKVAQTPGAIGYGAQPLVVNQKTIRPIGLSQKNSSNYVSPVTASGKINKQVILDGSYPLIRRIFVILREDGEIDELAGRAYVNLLLSREGQALIDRAGYLSIRYQIGQ
jgi:phosphate transport system substrate-binding protein